jgi:hypothetical protein
MLLTCVSVAATLAHLVAAIAVAPIQRDLALEARVTNDPQTCVAYEKYIGMLLISSQVFMFSC